MIAGLVCMGMLLGLALLFTHLALDPELHDREWWGPAAAAAIVWSFFLVAVVVFLLNTW